MINKKWVIVSVTIMIIITGIVFFINVKKFDKYEDNNIISKSDISTKQNVITNVKENIKNKENAKNESELSKNELQENVASDNGSEKNEIEEQKENKNSTSENVTENTEKIDNNLNTTKITENKISDEELAINLAKKQWGGKNNDVYFNVEDEKSKGVYVVTVRDESTTAEVTSYTVNIKTKSVTENGTVQ